MNTIPPVTNWTFLPKSPFLTRDNIHCIPPKIPFFGDQKPLDTQRIALSNFIQRRSKVTIGELNQTQNYFSTSLSFKIPSSSNNELHKELRLLNQNIEKLNFKDVYSIAVKDLLNYSLLNKQAILSEFNKYYRTKSSTLTEILDNNEFDFELNYFQIINILDSNYVTGCTLFIEPESELISKRNNKNNIRELENFKLFLYTKILNKLLNSILPLKKNINKQIYFSIPLRYSIHNYFDLVFTQKYKIVILNTKVIKITNLYTNNNEKTRYYKYSKFLN